MENTQTQQAQGNGGNDAFVRTADALASAADSLALEFQRRKTMEIEQAKREEQQTAELRQKLVNIHEKIGQLLGTVGAVTVVETRRGRPAGSKNKPAIVETAQRGRAPSEETERAKVKVLSFLKANPGIGRGDIARNCKLDTSLVGRVLQILSDEGAVKMAGDRRGAVWSAK